MVTRGFWSSDRNLSVLMVVIVVSIFVIGPITPAEGPGRLVLAIAYLALLISGIISVARSRRAGIAISAVAVASAGAYLTALWAPGSSTSLARALASGLFSLLLSGVVFERIFRAGSVTVHRISGAVAAYLLIGLVFSYAYDAIELIAPGSFYHLHPGTADASQSSNPLVYFSFTTLTTLGYGDVTPMHPIARALANLEALIGQLFPAILIARLVALEVSDRARSER